MFKKAQFFSVDILLALGIFLVLFLLSLLMWNFSQEKTEIVSQRADMEMKAELAMMQLLLSSGEPGNWYANGTYSSLGLMSTGDYQLDVVKLQGLVSLNNSYVNTSASLGLTKYQSFIRVVNASGVLYSFGVSTASSANDLVLVERIAVLDTRPVTVQVGVWQ